MAMQSVLFGCNSISASENTRHEGAVSYLCYIVTRRFAKSVGRVFDPAVSSAIAAFGHHDVRDEFT